MLYLALAVLLIVPPWRGPEQAPRDGVAKPSAPATVKGRVTSAATREPLHRVRITLNGALQNPPTTVTDTRGVFELTDVPAGSYSVTAVRAGYLTIQYGQRRPREAGRTLEIEAGQAIESIDIALSKGAVLAGRITDELGDPSPGTRVEAIELRYLRGRRVAVPATLTRTNDAGEYRLSGLEPGAYQVRASTTDVWEGDDGESTFTHAVTYYPGVTGADQPQSITVALGREIPAVDFRLIAANAARITGIVQDTNGQPLPGQVVHLSRAARTVGGARWYTEGAGTTRTDAAGAFVFDKLAPGEYIPGSGGEEERVTASLIVREADVQHVVLTPRKGIAAAGSIVSDDETPLPFPAARVRVSPVPVDAQSVLPSFTEPGLQTVKADWTFQIARMNGGYVFRTTGLPDDWMLKAVLLGGRDITDEPLAIRTGGSDVAGLRLVLSRKGAKVTGQVVDRTGAPAADSTVVIFAENPATWRLASRFIKAVRPDGSGRFAIGGLPPGAYCAIARDFVVDGQWEDPDFLQSLVRDAVRVNLTEASTETLELTVEVAR